jgi:hypothetical protein
MALTPEWEAELNRLGVEAVRDLLLRSGLYTASVQLKPGRVDNPQRGDVEAWLKARLDAREERDARVARHTWWAAIAAISAAVLGFAAVVIGLLAWLDPLH